MDRICSLRRAPAILGVALAVGAACASSGAEDAVAELPSAVSVSPVSSNESSSTTASPNSEPTAVPTSETTTTVAAPFPTGSDFLAAVNDDLWGRSDLDGREAGTSGHLVNLGGCVGLTGPDGDWGVGLLFGGLDPGLTGGMSPDGTTLNYLGRDVRLGSLVVVGGGWITLSEQDSAKAAEYAEVGPNECLAWSEPFFLVNTLTVAEPYPPGAPIDDGPGQDVAFGDEPPDYGMLVPPDALETLRTIWSLAEAGDVQGLSSLASMNRDFEASCCEADSSVPLRVWVEEFGSERAFVRSLVASLETWPRPTESGLRWGNDSGDLWLLIGYDGTWLRGSQLGK